MVLRTVDVEQLMEPDHRRERFGSWWGAGPEPVPSGIESVEGEAGRPAFDPQLLISLWIYVYSEGVSSAREVERRSEYHPAYQ